MIKKRFHVLYAAYRTMNANKSLKDLRLNVDWPTGCQHHFIMQNMLVIPVAQFQNLVIRNLYVCDICHNTTRYNKSKMDLGQCIFSDNATCNHLSCKTGFDNTDVSIVADF